METENKTMPQTIKNLLISDKYPDDREILRQINELARVVPGIRPKDVLRNVLLRILPEEITRLRNNPGRLAGG